MSTVGSTQLQPQQRFVVLDSLRGIAAVTVAIYHLSGNGFVGGNAFVRNGDALVDFFFVLSGFVIAAAYADKLVKGFSFRRYMVLRIGRIWPLHIVCLLLFVAYEALVWKSHAGCRSITMAFSSITARPTD